MAWPILYQLHDMREETFAELDMLIKDNLTELGQIRPVDGGGIRLESRVISLDLLTGGLYVRLEIDLFCRVGRAYSVRDPASAPPALARRIDAHLGRQ